MDRNKLILQKYIPEPAVHTIAECIVSLDFKLKIKRARMTKYGDYRPPVKGLNHRISVNRDLNKYAFLLTLLHEQVEDADDAATNRAIVALYGRMAAGRRMALPGG